MQEEKESDSKVSPHFIARDSSEIGALDAPIVLNPGSNGEDSVETFMTSEDMEENSRRSRGRDVLAIARGDPNFMKNALRATVFKDEFEEYRDISMMEQMKSVLYFYLYIIGPIFTSFNMMRSPSETFSTYLYYGLAYLVILIISLLSLIRIEKIENKTSQRRWFRFIAVTTVLSVSIVNGFTVLVPSDIIQSFFVLILSLVFQFQITVNLLGTGFIMLVTLIAHNIAWSYSNSGDFDLAFIVSSFSLGTFTYYNAWRAFVNLRTNFYAVIQFSMEKEDLTDQVKRMSREIDDVNFLAHPFKRSLSLLKTALDAVSKSQSRMTDEHKALNDMLTFSPSKNFATRIIASAVVRRNIVFFGFLCILVMLGATLGFYNPGQEAGVWIAISCSVSLSACDFFVPDEFFTDLENSYLSPFTLNLIFQAKIILPGLQVLPLTILYCLSKPQDDNMKGVLVLIVMGSQFFGAFFRYRPMLHCLIISIMLFSQYLVMELVSQQHEPYNIPILARILSCFLASFMLLLTRYKFSALHNDIQAITLHRSSMNNNELKNAMIQIQNELLGQNKVSDGKATARRCLITDEIVLSKVIGKGRFGNVYKGIWRSTEVAVKVVSISGMTTPEYFIKEMDLLCTLRHRNIVIFMGAVWNKVDRTAWLVSEFMERGSVWDLLRSFETSGSSLTLLQKITICLEAADGLNHMHLQTNPLVHGDLKSPSLFLTKHLELKIGDLGSSQRLTKGIKFEHANPVWVSPEILLGKKVTEKADIYSLAIIMWEICTGEIPFDSRNHLHIVEELNTRPPLREVFNLYESMGKLISLCWDEDPDERPTAWIVGEMLREMLLDIKRLETLNTYHEKKASSISLDIEDVRIGEKTGYISTNKNPLTVMNSKSSKSTLMDMDLMDSPVDGNSINFIENAKLEKRGEESDSENNDSQEAKLEKRRKRYDTQSSNSTSLTECFRLKEEEIQILNEIGRGSSSCVYKGFFRCTTVAVRCFKQDSDKFLKAMDFQLRLQHPNINTIMGFISEKDDVKMVVEYMERGDLYHVLHQPRLELDLSAKIRMALDIAKGVNYLHLNNPTVIHRDLKSPNLLVGQYFNVVVADLGLSRTITKTEVMTRCGSPAWLAPEIFKGLAYNESCDVYSYGIVLFEILTRLEPYKTEDKETDDISGIVKLMKNICSGLRPPLPSYLKSGIIEGDATKFSHCILQYPSRKKRDVEIIKKVYMDSLCNLITMCWQYDLKARPPMHFVIRSLESILTGIKL